jgi:hypothetical protein
LIAMPFGKFLNVGHVHVWDKSRSLSQPFRTDATVAHALLAKALGTTDADFINAILTQLANATCKGSTADQENLNFVLSVLAGVAPRDRVEAMLAAQMALVHLASMTFTRRLAHVDTIPQQDSSQNALNKLMRTFTNQMETLKRYRSGAQQTVKVEHVHVHEGGQAIVGWDFLPKPKWMRWKGHFVSGRRPAARPNKAGGHQSSSSAPAIE